MHTTAAAAQRRARNVGSRVAARRTSLGLSLDTVSARAGMATSYLEYVESRHGHPSIGVVRRLAEVLRTTPEQLYGEPVLEAPARFSRQEEEPEPPAAPHVVSRLTTPECLLLLGSVPIGRVAYVADGRPLVLPVNFTLMGQDIVLQTAAMSPLAELARQKRLITFEVDDIDEPSRLGWSVLCHGPSRLSAEADQPDPALAELVRPWIGGDRHTVVVISPTEITGRRIGLA